MEKLIYEGKAKSLFTTNDEEVLLVRYLDQATALNGKKKEQISGKGSLNNRISTAIFNRLAVEGVKTHLIETISETEQLVKKVAMIPLEVVIRNVVTGSFARRFAQEEGRVLAEPVLEFYLKSDALDDPFINLSQIEALKIATKKEMNDITSQTLLINQLLKEIFAEIQIELVDFKIEFGRYQGRIILADEISPDSCRLWDQETRESLDKDLFRKGQGDIIPVYQEVLDRLLTVKNEGGK